MIAKAICRRMFVAITIARLIGIYAIRDLTNDE